MEMGVDTPPVLPLQATEEEEKEEAEWMAGLFLFLPADRQVQLLKREPESIDLREERIVLSGVRIAPLGGAHLRYKKKK